MSITTTAHSVIVRDEDGDGFTFTERVDHKGQACVSTYKGAVYLDQEALRALRTAITAILDDEKPDTSARNEKTPTGAPSWDLSLLTVPEPAQVLFGVPLEVVQSLVEAALKSATVTLVDGA